MIAVQKLLATFQPSVDYAKDRYSKAHGAVVVSILNCLMNRVLYFASSVLGCPSSGLT